MPPSKDRMWTAWFMETRFNILANELDYLINHSDENILRLKEANPSCQQSETSHFVTKRKKTQVQLDTQNFSPSVVLKPI